MQRFEVGERVLVCKFMGESYDPPRVAVILSNLPARLSGQLFDYVVQGEQRQMYKVRDRWLVPFSITITEDPEYADLM